MKRQFIQIRVNDAQKYAIQKLAEKNQMTVTEYMLFCLRFVDSKKWNDTLIEWYDDNLK